MMEIRSFTGLFLYPMKTSENQRLERDQRHEIAFISEQIIFCAAERHIFKTFLSRCFFRWLLSVYNISIIQVFLHIVGVVCIMLLDVQIAKLHIQNCEILIEMDMDRNHTLKKLNLPIFAQP